MPLDPFIGSALVSAGSNLFSSFANGILGSNVNDDNRAYYDYAQQKANEFARSERIAAQEYNSPLNQLQLYSRAGMNPNLLTGQQFVPTSAVNNQPVSPPQAQSPWNIQSPISSQDLVNSAQSVSTNALRDGMVRLQNAQVDFTIANRHLTEQQAVNLRKDLDRLETSINEMNAHIRLMGEQGLYARAQRFHTNASEENIRLNTSWMPRLNKSTINESLSRIGLNHAQVTAIYENLPIVREQARSLKFQNDLNNANKIFLYRLPKQQYWANEASISFQRLTNGMASIRLQGMKDYYGVNQAIGVANGIVNVVRGAQEISPYQRAIDNGSKLMPFTSPGSPSPVPSPIGFNSSYSW